MNFRVANEKGVISKQMKDAKEVARFITREVGVMNDDDVILLYLNDDESTCLGKNVISVHLKDNILEVYNENCEVMCFYEHYDTCKVRVFFNAIKEEVEKFIKEYESSLYEQAEAAKENADYRVYIGSHQFKYIGRDADVLVYKVLEGLFSSISRDTATVVIRNSNTGSLQEIDYNKGFYTCSVKIDDGEIMTFEYYKPEKRRALMEFIRKVVIL